MITVVYVVFAGKSNKYFPFFQNVEAQMFSNRVSLNHATQTMDTNPIKTAITVCSELIQKQVK